MNAGGEIILKYKYANNENYKDYASGRVIYYQTGIPNYPVRLSEEIFARCFYIPKEQDITLFDPCCGGAYTLTVLGFLYGTVISTIIGSDIDNNAIGLASENLSLLSDEGLQNRRKQLERMIKEFNKNSHREALKSLSNLYFKINNRITTQCFVSDIFKTFSLIDKEFKADIVFADVPYGNLVNWSKKDSNPIDVLLDTLLPVISKDTIIAISSTKIQKISNVNYKRLEKIKIGKRKIEIMRLSNLNE